MIEYKFIKCKAYLEVSSKGMKPTEFESLDDVATFMLVSKQTLTYAHKHKRPLMTRWEGGAKVFFIEWLDRHNTYPSWINPFHVGLSYPCQ